MYHFSRGQSGRQTRVHPHKPPGWGRRGSEERAQSKESTQLWEGTRPIGRVSLASETTCIPPQPVAAFLFRGTWNLAAGLLQTEERSPRRQRLIPGGSLGAHPHCRSLPPAAHAHTHTHTHMHALTHTCSLTLIHSRSNMLMLTCLHTHSQSVHAHMLTLTHSRSHTRTHTHTQGLSSHSNLFMLLGFDTQR